MKTFEKNSWFIKQFVLLICVLSLSGLSYSAEVSEVEESKAAMKEQVNQLQHVEQKDDAYPEEPVGLAPAPPCTCYCLANWVGPIAAPYVPALPNTTTTTWFAAPPVQTEVEVGEEFWDANVNVKTYVCATNQVINVTAAPYGLVHNTYSKSKSRSLGFTGWGAWSVWSAIGNTGNLNNGQALATAAPPATPECTTVPIVCP